MIDKVKSSWELAEWRTRFLGLLARWMHRRMLSVRLKMNGSRVSTTLEPEGLIWSQSLAFLEECLISVRAIRSDNLRDCAKRGKEEWIVALSVWSTSRVRPPLAKVHFWLTSARFSSLRSVRANTSSDSRWIVSVSWADGWDCVIFFTWSLAWGGNLLTSYWNQANFQRHVRQPLALGGSGSNFTFKQKADSRTWSSFCNPEMEASRVSSCRTRALTWSLNLGIGLKARQDRISRKFLNQQMQGTWAPDESS